MANEAEYCIFSYFKSNFLIEFCHQTICWMLLHYHGTQSTLHLLHNTITKQLLKHYSFKSTQQQYHHLIWLWLKTKQTTQTLIKQNTIWLTFSVKMMTDEVLVWLRTYQTLQFIKHTCLTALFPGLPGRASTRKVKPTWILMKQETVSGIGNR